MVLADDAGAALEAIGDLVAEMVYVHHDVLHAVTLQAIHRPLEHRAAGHGNQRLGRNVGQRPHAFAAAGRQDHRCTDHEVPMRRSGGGINLSTQARSGAIASC